MTAKKIMSNKTTPDQQRLYQPLENLKDWQKVAFALGVCERIYPHFALYDTLVNTGDTANVRNLLDTLWQVLSGQTKCNTENQLEKVEGITINAEANFGASLAHDVQVALMLILNCIEEVDIEEITNIGLLSQDSVMKFLRLTHPETMDEDLIHDALMAQELVFQQTLMDQLKQLNNPKAIELKAIKQFAQNGGVSNIGIDLSN